MSNRLHVVLVHPEIHWNTGSIGRTCLAAGAQLHLVEPLGFSLSDRQVRRAGLDYWPRVQPRVWPDWDSLETELPNLGELYLLSKAGTRPVWEVCFPPRTVLVLGCESRGLPDPLRDRYPDRLLRIPQQPDSVRSLNLATAAGIAVYEVLRQRAPATRGDGPPQTA